MSHRLVELEVRLNMRKLLSVLFVHVQVNLLSAFCDLPILSESSLEEVKSDGVKRPPTKAKRQLNWCVNQWNPMQTMRQQSFEWYRQSWRNCYHVSVRRVVKSPFLSRIVINFNWITLWSSSKSTTVKMHEFTCCVYSINIIFFHTTTRIIIITLSPLFAQFYTGQRIRNSQTVFQL